jgi:hypothetical protein
MVGGRLLRITQCDPDKFVDKQFVLVRARPADVEKEANHPHFYWRAYKSTTLNRGFGGGHGFK